MDYLRADDFLLRPLPNHLFQRDNSAWIYDGLSHQPDGQARPQARDDQLPRRLQLPPDVPRRRVPFLYGNDSLSHEPATIEGGDVTVIGNRAVMIGMGERTTPQGIETLARSAVRRRLGRHRDRRRAPAANGRSCTSTPR